MIHKIVERPNYMSKLRTFRDKTELVKVLTGVRRCGKSTLLSLFTKELKESGVKEKEITWINFESSEFEHITDSLSLNDYLKKKVPRKGHHYVFLDEIQRVEDWEKTVNALMVDTEADIYVTGSNAYLLSSELSTYLTGRYVEIKVLPFSFAEYMELRGNGRDREDVFKEYFEYGGFPVIDPEMGKNAVSDVLGDLYVSIVFRDIVSRAEIRKPEELKKMINYLLLNIGNPIKSSNVAKELAMNVRTVEKYLSLVQSACLFYRADRYDLKSTALNPSPKYYVVDQGIRNNAVGMASKDLGHVLENMVYLELRRKGYDIIVGKWNSREVDFVTEKNGIKEYWQVCLGYDTEETEERELGPLKSIDDNNRKTVILLNNAVSGIRRDGIRELNAIDFFTDFV